MKASDIWEGDNSSLKRTFENALRGVGTKKVKSKICIVCGFDPKKDGKSIGCFHWNKKISNRHQYWYYE